MLKNISKIATIVLMAALVPFFISCSKSNKKYADEYYEKGLIFYKGMEYDRSIDDFTKALETNPKDKENYKVYYMRGRSYLKNRQYDKAISDFTKALEICPQTDKETKFLILESKGNSYHALNKNDDAIKDFSAAIAENIKYVYNNRGWAWRNMENYPKAVKDFYDALAIDPSFAPSYYGRALSWYKLGNLQRALEDAKEALRLAPETKKYDDLVFEIKAQIKKDE
jgi:tetratricopeptide (TPR) repeat protein